MNIFLLIFFWIRNYGVQLTICAFNRTLIALEAFVSLSGFASFASYRSLKFDLYLLNYCYCLQLHCYTVEMLINELVKSVWIAIIHFGELNSWKWYIAKTYLLVATFSSRPWINVKSLIALLNFKAKES